jgi:hypothetical protein
LSHQELGTLADSYRTSYVIDAMTVLMIAIKAIKYFQLQHDLALLKGTLAQAIGTCTHRTMHTMHVHTPCTHLGHTMNAPCTHHARTMHAPWTHLGRTLDVLACTMHAPWTSLHARRRPSATSLPLCLHQAITDLSVFVVLLLVILLGFVIMASNIFGSQVMSYRDIFSAFGTLLLIRTPTRPQPSRTPDLGPDADPLTLHPPPLPLTLKAWPYPVREPGPRHTLPHPAGRVRFRRDGGGELAV